MSRDKIEPIGSPHRQQVDGFEITGFQYRTPEGVCWSLTTVNSHGKHHHLWLKADGQFHHLTTDMNDVFIGHTTQNIGEPANPNDDLRAAVAKAIKDWTDEPKT
jgi:hypothetical protein